MAPEDEDPLGAETPGGDHAAQADGPVADDGHVLAGSDPRGAGGVVPGSHHVREREQRRHQRVVLVDREDDEGPVRLGDTYGFSLAAVLLGAAPPAAVQARGLKTLAAEDAGPVRPGERSDDEVARLDGADVRSDRLYPADELVAHPAALLGRFHGLVRPEVAAADTGAGDDEKRVGRLVEACVGDVLDSDIACAVHDSGSHWRTFRSGSVRVTEAHGRGARESAREPGTGSAARIDPTARTV